MILSQSWEVSAVNEAIVIIRAICYAVCQWVNTHKVPLRPSTVEYFAWFSSLQPAFATCQMKTSKYEEFSSAEPLKPWQQGCEAGKEADVKLISQCYFSNISLYERHLKPHITSPPSFLSFCEADWTWTIALSPGSWLMLTWCSFAMLLDQKQGINKLLPFCFRSSTNANRSWGDRNGFVMWADCCYNDAFVDCMSKKTSRS